MFDQILIYFFFDKIFPDLNFSDLGKALVCPLVPDYSKHEWIESIGRISGIVLATFRQYPALNTALLYLEYKVYATAC